MVVVRQDDRAIHADILKEEHFMIPKSEINYYCYYQGKINKIQGSYTGLLLTGFYEEFGENKELLTQGHFYYGTKHGRWKEWHETGKLKKIQIWDKGEKSGAFQEFDEEGKEIKRGQYKNNEPTGKMTILQDGEVKEEIYYKDGKETEKEPLFSFKKDKKEGAGKSKPNTAKKEDRQKTDKKPLKDIFRKKEKETEEKSQKEKKDKVKPKRMGYFPPENTATGDNPVIKINQKPVAPKSSDNNDKHKKYFSRRFPF